MLRTHGSGKPLRQPHVNNHSPRRATSCPLADRAGRGQHRPGRAAIRPALSTVQGRILARASARSRPGPPDFRQNSLVGSVGVPKFTPGGLRGCPEFRACQFRGCPELGVSTLRNRASAGDRNLYRHSAALVPSAELETVDISIGNRLMSADCARPAASMIFTPVTARTLTAETRQ